MYFKNENKDSTTFAHIAERNSGFLNLSLGIVEEPTVLFALVMKEDKDLINININDCLKIESVNRIVTYHHLNGCMYSSPQKMSDFSISCALKDLGIVRLDHRNLVNLNYIRLFDSEKGEVYFEKEPKESAPKAHVAAKNRSFVEAHLELKEQV